MADNSTELRKATGGVSRRPACAFFVAALAWLAGASAAEAAMLRPPNLAGGPGRLHLQAEYREFDVARRIAIASGHVQFIPPKAGVLIVADAGIVWFREQEAYLEGNVRIHRLLGAAGDAKVPKPDLGDRTGLNPEESLEPAGDLDGLLREKGAPRVRTDPRFAVSEVERVYVNWGDGTAYLVKPTVRLARAGRAANWVVTAPDAAGIATYRVPVRRKDGTFTGRYQERRHVVVRNATFTTCTFKVPHTKLTINNVEMVEREQAVLWHLVGWVGRVPFLYVPRYYSDFKYAWPYWQVSGGQSSSFGTFATLLLRVQPIKPVKISSRVHGFSDRGVAVGLGAEYEFGHGKEIRGALDAFWLPHDSGQDTSVPLGVDERHRVKYVHQQEWPTGWEFDVEVQKFSDAGVYREYFEREFKEDRDPETRAYLKYGRGNWAVFVHVKHRINDFLDQTEYLPQLGVNVIAQPIGAGFLFSTDTEAAHVRSRFANTRRRIGQSTAVIRTLQRRHNEYTRPPALTLRETDTGELTTWRFDTLSVISRPFELGVFDLEPFVGWRGTWYEHGVEQVRGRYAAATPPVGPALPGPVATEKTRTGARVRSQLLGGFRAATQFHRTRQTVDSPFWRQFFPGGQRHIITPEIFYVYEHTPSLRPRHLPDHDEVTSPRGLQRFTFALRNRWQTRWKPADRPRGGEAPGGEWFRRKAALEKMEKESRPVNVVDLDMEIDFLPNFGRDGRHVSGTGRRRLSNLRTDLAVRPWRRTTLYADSEYDIEDAGLSGFGGFQVISAGVRHKVRDGLSLRTSASYRVDEAALVGAGATWDINPRWKVGFDVAHDIAGRGEWDRSISLTRRLHEWQLTLVYEFDRGEDDQTVTVSISPTETQLYRPGWRFQPRPVAGFELVETAR
jgi:hypothetical protein